MAPRVPATDRSNDHGDLRLALDPSAVFNRVPICEAVSSVRCRDFPQTRRIVGSGEGDQPWLLNDPAKHDLRHAPLMH
jgi:hypothetical protein